MSFFDFVRDGRFRDLLCARLETIGFENANSMNGAWGENTGGIRAPRIACWPRKIPKSGSIVHDLAHATDFFPTGLNFKKVTGLEYPNPCQKFARS